MTTMLTDLTVSELAQVLFASAVQPSDASTPERIRAAVDERLCACGQAFCAAFVAQEAGDHPESYAARMRWALDTVAGAYRKHLVAA
ncbi:hypothetical protein [Nonomuraea sp. NPDC048826]|uniref:hypothetical protein n=1 Tax=Nonomuraea sp. NPDC048826 TaxID=3364347 RepID=UPI003723DDCD